MSIKKNTQLGMSLGTAANRLRKQVMFSLVVQIGLDECYRCKQKITSSTELTIEHKESWLDSEDPVKLYYDLNNIAFSHLSCNSRASRQTRTIKHPSRWTYKKGCRCEGCKKAHAKYVKKYRQQRKTLPSSNG
jgi:hypothetical protein